MAAGAVRGMGCQLPSCCQLELGIRLIPSKALLTVGLLSKLSELLGSDSLVSNCEAVAGHALLVCNWRCTS